MIMNDYYFCLRNKHRPSYYIPALTKLGNSVIAKCLFFTDDWYGIIAEIIFINGYK